MISEEIFGNAKLFTLKNQNGLEIKITNYGGVIASILVPLSPSKKIDVALGYSTQEGYMKAPSHAFFGALVGRFANRIKDGKFTLNGKNYSLAVNNGTNHLHGGKIGFDQANWNYQVNSTRTELSLTHRSPDGDENYPGNLDLRVVYRLSEENVLEIEYEARTDQATPINLTNHSYFNLEGEGNPSVLDHEIQIFASRFTPVHPNLIPTGELASVQKTPFDFLHPKKIGKEIDADHPQIQLARGYDHNYVVDSRKEKGLPLIARVKAPGSGIEMKVWSSEPGVQFYTGNFLEGQLIGKSGEKYGMRSGFCLETQHFPDSPNQPKFPNTILKPGEVFKSKTCYGFNSK